jgi:tetratricopeptide (TPR) repeat protein
VISKRATAIYEQLLKDNPAFYQQLSWELRDPYQRIGKGKDLAKIEDNMAQKARDPNQLRQMADRYRNSEDWDKAIEIYEKIVKMSPQDTYAKTQLAKFTARSGRSMRRLNCIASISIPRCVARGAMWIRITLQKIAGLYSATGKLQELKDYSEAELRKNPTDANAKCLKAHIAIMEKRFPEALDYYEDASKQGRDANALYQLMQLAETTGDVGRILKIVDSTQNQQQYWDMQRVAQFFQAQGNEEKARAYYRKWADQRIQNGGGWDYSEILRTLVQSDFTDLAEEFAGKHRRDNMDDYYKQEFDRTLVGSYVRKVSSQMSSRRSWPRTTLAGAISSCCVN